MDPTDLEGQVEFPSLDSGVTLLSMDERATGALQSLVLDHLLMNDGLAYWVDARNNATTTTLARIAPSMRILDRIQVARAFTPFQHYGIVDDLPAVVDPTVSMLVLPDIDWFYTEDELRRGEGEAMLAAVLDTIADLAATYEIPVVLSRHADRSPGGVLEARVDVEIECTLTQFGPRFSGSEFETLLFECDTGVQTTLAFWRRVLQARQAQTLSEPQSEVTPVGTH
jgi:hypothetical protein